MSRNEAIGSTFVFSKTTVFLANVAETTDAFRLSCCWCIIFLGLSFSRFNLDLFTAADNAVEPAGLSSSSPPHFILWAAWQPWDLPWLLCQKQLKQQVCIHLLRRLRLHHQDQVVAYLSQHPHLHRPCHHPSCQQILPPLLLQRSYDAPSHHHL